MEANLNLNLKLTYAALREMYDIIEKSNFYRNEDLDDLYDKLIEVGYKRLYFLIFTDRIQVYVNGKSQPLIVITC